MLKVRKAQMASMADYTRGQFEDQMVAHLQANFPDHVAAWTDERLHTTVRESIDRAKHYGVVKRPDVRRYIEHEVMYGPLFETRTGTRWAQPILQDGALNGTQKMDRIDDIELFRMKGRA